MSNQEELIDPTVQFKLIKPGEISSRSHSVKDNKSDISRNSRGLAKSVMNEVLITSSKQFKKKPPKFRDKVEESSKKPKMTKLDSREILNELQKSSNDVNMGNVSILLSNDKSQIPLHKNLQNNANTDRKDLNQDFLQVPNKIHVEFFRQPIQDTPYDEPSNGPPEHSSSFNHSSQISNLSKQNKNQNSKSKLRLLFEEYRKLLIVQDLSNQSKSSSQIPNSNKNKYNLASSFQQNFINLMHMRSIQHKISLEQQQCQMERNVAQNFQRGNLHIGGGRKAQKAIVESDDQSSFIESSGGSMQQDDIQTKDGQYMKMKFFKEGQKYGIKETAQTYHEKQLQLHQRNEEKIKKRIIEQQNERVRFNKRVIIRMLQTQKREQGVSQYSTNFDHQMEVLQNKDLQYQPKSDKKTKEKSQAVINPYFKKKEPIVKKPKKQDPQILHTNSSLTTISIRINHTETSLQATTEQSQDMTESFASDDSYYEETEAFNVACLNRQQVTEKKLNDIAQGIEQTIKSQKKLDVDVEANKLREVFEIGEILQRGGGISEVSSEELEKILKFLQKLPGLKGKFDLLSISQIRSFLHKIRMKILPRGKVLDIHTDNCLNAYVTLVGVVNLYEDTLETQFLKNQQAYAKEAKTMKFLNQQLVRGLKPRKTDDNDKIFLTQDNSILKQQSRERSNEKDQNQHQQRELLDSQFLENAQIDKSIDLIAKLFSIDRTIVIPGDLIGSLVHKNHSHEHSHSKNKEEQPKKAKKPIAICKTDCILLELDHDVIHIINRQIQQRQKKSCQEALVKALPNILNAYTELRINETALSVFAKKVLYKDQVIQREGQSNEGDDGRLFIIHSGKMQILKTIFYKNVHGEALSREEVLMEIHGGDVIGEDRLWHQRDASYSAKVISQILEVYVAKNIPFAQTFGKAIPLAKAFFDQRDKFITSQCEKLKQQIETYDQKFNSQNLTQAQQTHYKVEKYRQVDVSNNAYLKNKFKNQYLWNEGLKNQPNQIIDQLMFEFDNQISNASYQQKPSINVMPTLVDSSKSNDLVYTDPQKVSIEDHIIKHQIGKLKSRRTNSQDFQDVDNYTLSSVFQQQQEQNRSVSVQQLVNLPVKQRAIEVSLKNLNTNRTAKIAYLMEKQDNKNAVNSSRRDKNKDVSIFNKNDPYHFPLHKSHHLNFSNTLNSSLPHQQTVLNCSLPLFSDSSIQSITNKEADLDHDHQNQLIIKPSNLLQPTTIKHQDQANLKELGEDTKPEMRMSTMTVKVAQNVLQNQEEGEAFAAEDGADGGERGRENGGKVNENIKIKIDIKGGGGEKKIEEVKKWGQGNDNQKETKYLSHYREGRRKTEESSVREDQKQEVKDARNILHVGYENQFANERNTDRSLHTNLTKGSESLQSKELSPQLNARMANNTEQDKTQLSKKKEQSQPKESPYRTERSQNLKEPDSVPEQTISIKTMVTNKKDDQNHLLRAKSFDQSIALQNTSRRRFVRTKRFIPDTEPPKFGIRASQDTTENVYQMERHQESVQDILIKKGLVHLKRKKRFNDVMKDLQDIKSKKVQNQYQSVETLKGVKSQNVSQLNFRIRQDRQSKYNKSQVFDANKKEVLKLLGRDRVHPLPNDTSRFSQSLLHGVKSLNQELTTNSQSKFSEDKLYAGIGGQKKQIIQKVSPIKDTNRDNAKVTDSLRQTTETIIGANEEQNPYDQTSVFGQMSQTSVLKPKHSNFQVKPKLVLAKHQNKNGDQKAKEITLQKDPYFSSKSDQQTKELESQASHQRSKSQMSLYRPLVNAEMSKVQDPNKSQKSIRLQSQTQATIQKELLKNQSFDFQVHQLNTQNNNNKFIGRKKLNENPPAQPLPSLLDPQNPANPPNQYSNFLFEAVDSIDQKRVNSSQFQIKPSQRHLQQQQNYQLQQQNQQQQNTSLFQMVPQKHAKTQSRFQHQSERSLNKIQVIQGVSKIIAAPRARVGGGSFSIGHELQISGQQLPSLDQRSQLKASLYLGSSNRQNETIFMNNANDSGNNFNPTDDDIQTSHITERNTYNWPSHPQL